MEHTPNASYFQLMRPSLSTSSILLALVNPPHRASSPPHLRPAPSLRCVPFALIYLYLLDHGLVLVSYPTYTGSN